MNHFHFRIDNYTLFGYLSNFATGSLKFPFFLKMAIFVNLEVPFFI